MTEGGEGDIGHEIQLYKLLIHSIITIWLLTGKIQCYMSWGNQKDILFLPFELVILKTGSTSHSLTSVLGRKLTAAYFFPDIEELDIDKGLGELQRDAQLKDTGPVRHNMTVPLLFLSPRYGRKMACPPHPHC